LKPSTTARLIVSILIVLELTCIVLSQGRGGAGGGGGARGAPPAAQRGERAGGPRGPAPARGAPRGARGEGRGERRGERPDPNEILEPDNGLVTTYVTVTGKDRRAVPGLTRANFQIFEDNVEQEIGAFSVENGPITAGFLVGGDPSEFRGIAPAFLKATPWEDEFFVLVDDGRPPGGTVIQNFTRDILRVPKNFIIGGISADTIYVGLDYMKEAANRRKILLLFGGSLTADGTPTGGLDPNYVVRMATKQGVQVHSILTNSNGTTTFDDAGTSDIAPLTGGRSYIAMSASGTLETIAEEIAAGLTVQYFIGYRTTNPEKDGKWRGIKVQLVGVPETLGKLSVQSRSGYYAEKEKKK
jgi:Ca-activated chloride channel family protein